MSKRIAVVLVGGLLAGALSACASAPAARADLGDACVFSGPGTAKPTPQRPADDRILIGQMDLNGRRIDVYRRSVSLIPARQPDRAASCGATG